MTNIIKCRFLDKDSEPRGREYSYKTEIPVEVGQIVDVPAPRQSDTDNELRTYRQRAGMWHECAGRRNCDLCG